MDLNDAETDRVIDASRCGRGTEAGTATDTRRRETRALLQAGRELACDRLLVLTADTDAEQEVEWYGMRGRVRLQPIRRWLSDPPAVE